jgi:hypothetical protein
MPYYDSTMDREQALDRHLLRCHEVNARLRTWLGCVTALAAVATTWATIATIGWLTK